jgi:hypothetical protein
MKRFAVQVALIPLAFLGAVGCGSQEPTRPPVESIPEATTPQNAMTRFERLYEGEGASEYGTMLTTNFRYQFSSHVDPLLVRLYPEGLFKADEVTAAQNLFGGFIDTEGDPVPGAMAIHLDLLPSNRPVDDPGRAGGDGVPDSTRWYKKLEVPNLFLSVATGPDEGYYVDGRHLFRLVRGDAAALDPGQQADSTRWYIYSWEDQTSGPHASLSKLETAPASFSSPLPARPATWGLLKAIYLGIDITEL